MSEGELISHPASEAVAPAAMTDPIAPATVETPADIKAETAIEAPKVESPAIQPQIEEIAQTEPAPVIVATSPDPAIDTATTDPIEIPAAEPKMPPVAQLAAPIAQLVGAAPEATAPPDFLREHTTRIIAAKPPLRAEPRPAFRPKPKIMARPELKAPPRAEPKIEPGPKAERAPRPARFALLAASVAICACMGAAAGSAGIIGISRLSATAPVGAAADVQTLREQIAQLTADVAATRTSVEHINRSTGAQFGKIVERFDRIDHAQADPAAKLAKIGETLDKLEKRVASIPTTPAPTAAAAPPPATANDVTGSIAQRPAPEPKASPKTPPILEGFILRRVYDGVALVESRMGVVELVPGAPLPGGGRVEDIRREDGRWVVVTSRGLIVSQR